MMQSGRNQFNYTEKSNQNSEVESNDMSMDATMIVTKSSDRFTSDVGYTASGQARKVISDETMLLDMDRSLNHSRD